MYWGHSDESVQLNCIQLLGCGQKLTSHFQTQRQVHEAKSFHRGENAFRKCITGPLKAHVGEKKAGLSKTVSCVQRSSSLFSTSLMNENVFGWSFIALDVGLVVFNLNPNIFI